MLKTDQRPIAVTRAASIAALLAATGCLFVGEPPPDTILLCDTDDDCPSGWDCLASGRCLSPTVDDAVAPQLLGVVVSPGPTAPDEPSRVTAGTELTVWLRTDLDVDELVFDSVALVRGDVAAPLARAPELDEPGDRGWALSLLIVSTLEAGEYNLQVSLLSPQGARLFDPTAAAVVIDFTNPALSDAAVSPAALRSGETVTASFVVDEPLASVDLVAELGDGRFVFTPSSDDGLLDRRFEALVPDAIGDGVYELIATITDLAGNARSERLIPTVRIDDQAPGVAPGTIQFGETFVRPGQPLGVRFTPTEALAHAPQVVMLSEDGGPPLDWGEGALVGGSYVYSLLAPNIGSATFTVVARELQDLVGNTSPDDAVLGQVTIDGEQPAISELALNNTVFSAVDGFNTLTLTFNAENVADDGGALVVLLGGTPVDCNAYSATAPNHVCTFTVTDATAPGAQQLTITLTDGAGNPTTVAVPVVIDLEPPVVDVNAISISPATVRPGQGAAITVAVSEPVAPGAVLTVSGGAADLDLVAAGDAPSTLLTFSFTPDGTDGPRTLTLAPVVDLAGNASAQQSVVIGSVTVDGLPP
jgi:hypothetical protein